jgi:predicted DNA binding CopG/RHH family protein
MNKKNIDEIISENKTIRFTKSEVELIKQKSENAGMSFSAYCREIAVNGYVQAVRNVYDMNEIRLFKNLLLEYKTNFSRISNRMKVSDPYLNEEVKQTRDSIQQIIDKINL